MTRLKAGAAILIGALAALILVVVYSKTGPPSRERLIIGYQPNVIYLPVFVAEEREYFADEKLNVALFEFPSANEMIDALKTEKIHITGMSSLSVIARCEAQTPDKYKLLTLEQFSPKESPDAIVVRGDANIGSISDLRGRVLGTWMGSTIKTYTKLILMSEKVPPDSVKIIPMGKSEMAEFFNLAKLDAAFTFEPWVAKLILEGKGKILERAPLANRLLASPQVIYPGGSATLAAFAQDNPKIIEKFQRAYRRAVDDIQRNWRANLEILKLYSEIDDKTLDQMGSMNWVIASKKYAPDVQKLLNLYVREGITEDTLSANNLMWNN